MTPGTRRARRTAAAVAMAAAGATSAVPATSVAGGETTATRCVGTVQVTDTDAGAVLGRLTLAGGVADVARKKKAWARFVADRPMRQGGLGQLHLDGERQVLEGFVGGFNAEPRDLMETGTADNVYFQPGEPNASAPYTDRATAIWRLRTGTGALRAVWTQPDGSRFPLTGWYDEAGSYTGSAADFEAFDERVEGRAVPVAYTFVPARGAVC